MKNKFIIIISIFSTTFCFAQTQMEMNMQANAEYKKADKEMAAVYKKVQKKITDPKEKTLFLEAQRTWIKYKEAHCKSASAAELGGSIYPLVYASCLRKLTEQRTAQLNEYLKTY